MKVVKAATALAVSSVLLLSGCGVDLKADSDAVKSGSLPTSTSSSGDSGSSSDSTSSSDAPSSETSSSSSSSSSSSTWASPTTGEITGKKGEDIKSTKYSLKVNSVTDPVKVPDDSFSKPASGTRWVKVNVTVKNMGSEEEYISSMDFKARDEDTTLRSEFIISDDVAKALPTDKTQPGATVTGDIIFEVDEGKKLKSVTFDPLDFSGDTRTLTATL